MPNNNYHRTKYFTIIDILLNDINYISNANLSNNNSYNNVDNNINNSSFNIFIDSDNSSNYGNS